MDSQGVAISIDDFAKVDLRIGRIVSAEDIPAARNPMYKLTVDFGNGNSKQCVAGIKNFYPKEHLVGRLVVAAVNLQPKSVAGVVSECMLLAAYNEKELALLSPDKELSLGTKVG